MATCVKPVGFYFQISNFSSSYSALTGRVLVVVVGFWRGAQRANL